MTSPAPDPDPYEVSKAVAAETQQAGKRTPPAKRAFGVGDTVGLILLVAWGSELALMHDDSFPGGFRGTATALAGPVLFVTFRLRPMPFWPAYGLGFLGSVLPIMLSLMRFG